MPVETGVGVSSVRPRDVLEQPRRMCYSCGSDLGKDDHSCSSCGTSAGRLPGRLLTPVGTLHRYRKGLRHRLALRLRVDADSSILLLEDGTEQITPHGDVPGEAPPLLAPEALAVLRSPQGKLVRFANAIKSGEITVPWPAELLERAAVEQVASNIIASRLLAADVVMLGRLDLLDDLELSSSERCWLRFLNGAARRDPARVLEALDGLDPTRYRPKLGVLLAMASRLGSDTATAERLRPHLDAFADTERSAVVLRHRIGGRATIEESADDIAWYADHLLEEDAPLQTDARFGLAMLREEAPNPHALPRYLDAPARLLAARRDPARSSSLLRPPDLPGAPAGLLDDLIDGAGVDLATIQAAALAPDVARYLKARVAPGSVDDADIAAVGHTPEQMRRAFVHRDGIALGGFEDSEVRRHYETLLALLRNRPDDVVVENVAEASREVVVALLRILGAVQAADDPMRLLDDVVLRDATVWPVLVTIAGFDQLIPSTEFRQSYAAFCEWLSLVQAREHLYVGAWSAAAEASRSCLALAVDEDVRDEALNLLACALHNMNDNTAAIQALEKAIEGRYSDSLLANIGIVAAQLEPERAARHLGRLVLEAPTIAMRAAAAERAVQIWLNTDKTIWTDDGAVGTNLPPVLRDPLRTLIDEPISLDSFRGLVTLFAYNDALWLCSTDRLRNSPHRNSLEAQYFVARAHGPDKAVAILATIADFEKGPSWCLWERDNLIEQTIQYLFANMDENNNVATSVAFTLAQKVKGVGDVQQIALSLLALANYYYPDNAWVTDEHVAILTAARRRRLEAPEDLRDLVDKLVNIASIRMAFNVRLACAREMDDWVDHYNDALRVLRYATVGTAQWSQARTRIASFVQKLHQIEGRVTDWIPLVDDIEMKRGLADFINVVRDNIAKARRVLG